LAEVVPVEAGNGNVCAKCGTTNTRHAQFCGTCGAALSTGGGFVGAETTMESKGRGMSAGKIVLVFFGILVVAAAVVGGCGYGGYKHTITLDEAVKSHWADVEVVLQRRFDLIPNVVETVKGYASHEKEVLQGIADVRKSYVGAGPIADKAKAAGELEGYLSRLLVISENYPQLRASENFHALQVELEGTENRIKEKRLSYNAAVKELNAYIRAFPGSLYAKWADVKPGAYFEAGAGAKEAPKVKF
jgi:LemA protein